MCFCGNVTWVSLENRLLELVEDPEATVICESPQVELRDVMVEFGSNHGSTMLNQLYVSN